MRSIIQLLQVSCALVSLDLSGNTFPAKAWALLAEALPLCPTLQVLILKRCGLSTGDRSLLVKAAGPALRLVMDRRSAQVANEQAPVEESNSDEESAANDPVSMGVCSDTEDPVEVTSHIVWGPSLEGDEDCALDPVWVPPSPMEVECAGPTMAAPAEN